MPDPHRLAEPQEALFRTVLGRFATGVTLLTSMDGGAPVGMAVNSFTSVSLAPPLVSFCAAHTSTTWPLIRAAGRLCVNILGAHQQAALRQFVARRSRERFGGVAWTGSPDGLPVLDGALAWLECSVEDEFRAGDHDIGVARVRRLSGGPEQEPLVFYAGRYGRFCP